MELEYIHSATQRGRESAQIVQQMFKAIGVTVKAMPMDWGTIYKRMFSRQFDLASWGIPGHRDMGVTTRLVFHTKSPWNLSGYSNEIVDRLLIEQKMSVDRGVHQKALCEATRQVNEDAPNLLMCGRRYHRFKNLKVRGLPPPQNNSLLLEDAWLEP